MNGLNNRNLFLTILDAVKSKTKKMADSVSGGIPLPGFQTAILSLYPYLVER